MSTLIMVRTVCCETYKCNGVRCSICPNRPENREAAKIYKEQMASRSLGRRYRLSTPPTPPVAVADAPADCSACSC